MTVPSAALTTNHYSDDGAHAYLASQGRQPPFITVRRTPSPSRSDHSATSSVRSQSTESRRSPTLQDEKGTDVESEKMVEIDFANGKPVRVADRFGKGAKR